MNNLTQKEWLEYINRLQERERQKLSSSGLNNWTLLITLGAVIYWFTSRADLMINNWTILLLFSTLFSNLIVGLGDLFNATFRTSKIVNFRFNPNSSLDKNISSLLRIFESSVVYIILLFNVLSLIKFPYLGYFFILYIIRSVAHILMSLVRKEVTEQLNKTGYNQNKVLISAQVYFIYSLLPFLYFLAFKSFPSSDQITLIVSGFLVVVIINMLQFLIVIFLKRIKISWLEALERDIFIKNLKENEIKGRLINGYFSTSNIDDYF